jgi:hypothetical protein
MAKSLSFDTGLVEYDINGVSVRFNPTDETLADGIMKMIESLLTVAPEALSKKGNFGDTYAELDVEARKKFDSLFGDGVADKLFLGMNSWAMADGLPVWLNCANLILEEFVKSMGTEFGKTDERVKGLKSRYDKIMSKYRKPKGKR